MKELIANFPNQLVEALEIGSRAIFKTTETPINNVLITGLGGSGIGGTIISQLLENNISPRRNCDST